MHISEQVHVALCKQGFEFSLASGEFSKLIEGFAAAGQFSNGRRVVRVRMDDTGRWLERVDGWGKVERDVDLRNFPDQPEAAIAAVLA